MRVSADGGSGVSRMQRRGRSALSAAPRRYTGVTFPRKALSHARFGNTVWRRSARSAALLHHEIGRRALSPAPIHVYSTVAIANYARRVMFLSRRKRSCGELTQEVVLR